MKKTKKRQRRGNEVKDAGARARDVERLAGWLDRSSTLSEVLRRDQQIGEGGEEGRIAKKAAGALQKFTRGPVHEHVKVEPGAHRWLPSRTSSAYVNSYARVRVTIRTLRRGGEDLGTCPSRVSEHTVLHSEYPALKPTITLF